MPRRVRLDDSFAGEKPKEILSATTTSLIEEAERPARFAVRKILTHHRQSHAARVSDFLFSRYTIAANSVSDLWWKADNFQKGPRSMRENE